MKRRRVAKRRKSAGPAGDGRSDHAHHGPGSGESLIRSWVVARLSVRRPRPLKGDWDKPCQTRQTDRFDAELYVIVRRRSRSPKLMRLPCKAGEALTVFTVGHALDSFLRLRGLEENWFASRSVTTLTT
jgi:hypothetical protein